MKPRYRTLADYIWIPLVGLFLFPVLRHVSLHDPFTERVEQGPLLTGIGSLDSLLAEAEGRPVLINFWATWCTPCIGELPHIDRLYRSMEGSFQAIAVDIGDPRLETLLGFREEVSLSMPVVWLNQEESEMLKDRWELPDVLPVTIMLDRDGLEMLMVAGVRDEEFFRQALAGSIDQDHVPLDTAATASLHINVVGSPSDSLTILLIDSSVELAGEGGVDVFDPSSPADSASMEEMHLPFTDFPYAQPCIGSACGRLARTPEDLVLVVGSLSD